MADTLLQQSVTEFEKVTGLDITNYLTEFYTFAGEDYHKITGFYLGEISAPNDAAFETLSNLIAQATRIQDLLILHKMAMSSTIMWSLLDTLDNIKSKLDTIDNSDRWMRSSVIKNTYQANPEFDHVLSQNETIESLAGTLLGSNDPDSDWAKIAQRNDLSEEDYSPAGGALLQVSLKGAISAFTIESVVDVIVGKSVYGKDFNRVLTFVNDGLEVLSYTDTALQGIEVLMTLTRGANPQFPELGLQQKFAIGTTLASLSFPVIFRQLSQSFLTDDSLKSFTLLDVTHDRDGVLYTFSIQTRLDELITKQITI